MGFNTVAVLYNDFTAEIRDSGRVGARIAEAMRGWYDRERPDKAHFGAGVVISQAHADCEQVVIVARNTGQRASDATDLGWVALAQMQECLERHGYRVTKPKRRRAVKAETP